MPDVTPTVARPDRAGPERTPLSDDERRLARALARCTYVPGSPDKRFARHLGEVAGDPRADLSERQRDVWTVATEPFSAAHFAVFPTGLIEPCILAGCQPGGVVLDPFAGSGTSGVVALRHGRRFVGLDLSPQYCEMARARIVGDSPMFNGQQPEALTCPT